MNPVEIIIRKRDGEELAETEIRQFIQGVSKGEIPDYQATAFLMAVYFQGMTTAETVALTQAMLESGEIVDLSSIHGVKVDKHSTGGVGDKVSLALAPLAAACGVKVPMMSGRGLGHSGGTLDKLESISGFQVRFPQARFLELLRDVGCAMIGQSEAIAPADKKLYSLRDVTGTVECIPLIVASILSKKLAEGTQFLVLDVKFGSGAFMKSRNDARKLARALIQVGKKLGLGVRAVLTNMDQPLGNMVGNALEVVETVQLLRNEPCGPDLKEITINLCAHMLEMSKISKTLEKGRVLATSKLADGSAYVKFLEMVRAQGGSVEQIETPGKLPLSVRKVTWSARKRGHLCAMNTEEVGRILVEMGGGRKKASDLVDPSVGLVFHKKLGSRVAPGDPIVTVYAPENASEAQLKVLAERFDAALEIKAQRKPVPKLIAEVLT